MAGTGSYALKDILSIALRRGEKRTDAESFQELAFTLGTDGRGHKLATVLEMYLSISRYFLHFYDNDAN